MLSSLIAHLVRQREEITPPHPPGETPGLPTAAQAPKAVPDARRAREQRHRLAFPLCPAVVAVLRGAKSLAAIVQWARDADEATLSAATLSALGPPTRRRPAATTIGRAFERLDADALDDAHFGWINVLFTDTPLDTAKVAGPVCRQVHRSRA